MVLLILPDILFVRIVAEMELSKRERRRDSLCAISFFMEKIMDLRELSTNDIEFLIEQYIHNEVHRKILKRRLLDHIKFDDLAEEFNYSVRQVKRIVYKNQDILYSRIRSADLSVGFSFTLSEV